MASLRSFMTDDHRHCDDLFAAVEQAVAKPAWPAAQDVFEGFAQAMAAHFAAEEATLFPAFEAKTGMSMGPTRVMRAEHAQMRDLLAQIRQGLQDRDADAVLGHADTLLIMMQQHNMKEENVLYPLCDQHLADDALALLARLEKDLKPDLKPA